MTGRSVLIVEDDPDVRESLRDALEDEGYVVNSARNGLEGLELLRQDELPSLVIVDLIMPVMGGDELYQRMRAEPRLANVPVIVSTSDPSRAPSGVLIMRKPIELGALLRTIERLCRE